MVTSRNPLQEQLLKAGLAKKSKLNQIAREQAKQRQGKSAFAAGGDTVDAKQLKAEMAQRDRALSAERNAKSQALEQRAQVRQIVEQNRLPPDGEIEYRFTHNGAIRSVLVTDLIRRQLSKGVLAIACHDGSYAIVPRAAAEKIEMRDATMIALDHQSEASSDGDAGEDEHYAKFVVPDDLVW
jgi:hypothetical protein